MRTYASSRVKRKGFLEKKGTPDVFVDFWRPYWWTETVHQYGASIRFPIYFFVAWQWKRSITFSLKLLQFLSTIKFASTKSISVDNIFLSLSQQASCGHSIFFPILQFKIVYVFESSDYRKNMRSCSLTNADDGKAAFVKAKWKGSWWINIRFLVL